MKSYGIVLLLLGIFLAKVSWSAPYNIDKDHSSISFSVKHLMISNVKGQFNEFMGTFDYEPGKSELWKANAVIQMKSVNTNNKKRDTHLSSADFLDVKKFPTMTFKSTKVTDADSKSAKLHGDLTLHGVTKPVVLDLVVGGIGADFSGAKKAAFTAKTKISRKEFGLTYNKVLEAGGVAIGDEVEIALEVEGTEIQPQQEHRKAKK